MEAIQNLYTTITRMQWSDYLDIIVVAFLIYKLLPLLRTKNVMRIARTVMALVLLAWITGDGMLELHTLHWLLNQVLAIGLLAFVVLFQPELRKMLDHLGSVRLNTLFGLGKPVQEMEMVITQTVMACENMSQNKVGALIVFSREQNLEEYFKTGTVIDGQVNEQLLRNIFFHNAPLHDGAVIIKDGRVAAAGCVLPVSDNTRLSKELGTRHRAAVGISEASDAVAVVVSEENGTISVAMGGMLKRHLAPQTLEQLLRNELCGQDSEARERAAMERIPEKLSGTMQSLKKIGKKEKGADSYEKK